MLNRFEHLRLFRDRLFKRQFQDLLASSIPQSLRLDQFLLFQWEQDWIQVPNLVLCAATGVLPSEIIVPVDNALRCQVDQTSGAWSISDAIDSSGQGGALGEFVGRLGGRSMLVAPLNQNGLLWGFLVGYTIEVKDIRNDELQVFAFLAASLALLVENSQLRLGVDFHSSEAQSLEIISSALVENKNLDETLTLIADKTVRLLDAQNALVLLLEEGGEWFRVQGEIGIDSPSVAQKRMTVRDSLNGMVIMTGQPLISQDAQVDPRANHDRATVLNVKSAIIAPIKVRDRVIGTMAVHNKADGYFSEQDINTLCSFANQAAVAIDNTQLTTALMKAQKNVEEKAKTLQQLLKQTMDIQENERRRIATDIHDEVVSKMVGALYELEGCFQLDYSDHLGERLKLLKQLLNQAIEQTRTSIHNLWPATLDHMGLIPALQELFKHPERLTDVCHRLDIFGRPYQLNPATQIAVYRIVQEAINNACQHGMANQIDMAIHFSKRKISIEICDNGQGFDVHKVLQTPLACHFGLIGMRERAQSIGGRLTIKSQPGEGCKVTLIIPNTEATREGISRHDANTNTDCR